MVPAIDFGRITKITITWALLGPGVGLSVELPFKVSSRILTIQYTQELRVEGRVLSGRHHGWKFIKYPDTLAPRCPSLHMNEGILV